MNNDADVNKLQQAIAERIRTLRKAAGLTQEQLSEMSNLGPKYLSRLESARAMPSLLTILNIASALRVQPADLIGGIQTDARVAQSERITAALSGLDEDDAAFVEEELLDWVAHLKSKNR